VRRIIPPDLPDGRRTACAEDRLRRGLRPAVNSAPFDCVPARPRQPLQPTARRRPAACSPRVAAGRARRPPISAAIRRPVRSNRRLDSALNYVASPCRTPVRVRFPHLKDVHQPHFDLRPDGEVPIAIADHFEGDKAVVDNAVLWREALQESELHVPHRRPEV
jgi:hypothetical protein